MLPTSRKRPSDPSWRQDNTPKAPRVASIPSSASDVAHRSPRPPATHIALIPEKPKPTIFKPAIRHRPHPDSNLCQDFHWVPYPLGLMPFDSWHKFHNPADTYPQSPFRCPVCRSPRKATAHARKIFLVAERLTWEEGLMSLREKDQTEQLTWEANYELGILEPFVEDPEHIAGGKRSRTNKWHPYQNEYEMKQALNLIFVTENITEVSWSLWIGMQMSLQNMLEDEHAVSTAQTGEPPCKSNPKQLSQAQAGNQSRGKSPEMLDLTVSPDRASNQKRYTYYAPSRFGIPTPPSSNEAKVWTGPEALAKTVSPMRPLPMNTQGKMAPKESQNAVPQSQKSRRITSYKTRLDFYSLLDQIERTSYVGALFLEAYAEHLRDDLCRDCWLRHNVLPGAG